MKKQVVRLEELNQGFLDGTPDGILDYDYFFEEAERIDNDPLYFSWMLEREMVGDYTGYEYENHEMYL